MIPTTGPYDSTLVRSTFGLGASFTSAQLATAAGLSAAFTSEQLRGRSGNTATEIRINTNDPSGSGFTRHQVLGYSGNRNIRVERYGFSGDNTFSELKINVYTSTTKDGTYTFRGTIIPYGTGMAYLDFTLATNSWIKYEVVAATGAGKKTAQFEMVIWDLSAGVRIAQGSWVYVTVDADNNFIPVGQIVETGYGEYWAGSNGWEDEYYTNVSFAVNGLTGTPSSYLWSVTTSGYGGIYIAGSSNQPNVQLSTSNWVYGTSYDATITCRVTIGGVNHILTRNFTYTG